MLRVRSQAVAYCILSLLAHAASAQDTLAKPTNLDFEQGEAGKAPVGWQVTTPGWAAELFAEGAPQGKLALRLKKAADSESQWGSIQQAIAAGDFRNRRIELRAKVRVESPNGSRAPLWLRVERDKKTLVLLDTRSDKSAFSGTWTDAVITADIPPEADTLTIGFMAFGQATLFADDISLTSLGASQLQAASPAAALSPRGVENLIAASRLLAYVRFFHPSDQAVGVKDWSRVAIDLMEAAEPAKDAADLAERMTRLIAPLTPGLQIWAGDASAAPPLAPPPEAAKGRATWEHHGAPVARQNNNGPSIYSSKVVRKALSKAPSATEHEAGYEIKPLGGGVTCRLPVSVYFNDDGTLPKSGQTPGAYASQAEATYTAQNRSTRLAGVALAWGTMQHFYPYFDVVETDWDAALPVALTKAAQDADEYAYLVTLRELIAKLHDGHGFVSNPTLTVISQLPLAFGWAGDDLIIVGKHESAPADIAIGDIVLKIDGKSVAEQYAIVARCISAATEGWRRTTALRMLAVNLTTPEQVAVHLRKPAGAEYDATLQRIKGTIIPDVTAKRPADGTELAPGIVYLNLVGAGMDKLDKAMEKLNAAKGLIFDVRGYPADAAFAVIQHLIDEPATSARWNVPIVRRPDRQDWSWSQSGRWNMPPLKPRWTAKVAFLTDGGAISYAESIMGIIEAYKLGEIIGSTTAGTNGNVNPFVLPGGIAVSWTGMKVLKHDGSRHHGVGIHPTVPVERTAAGVAAGRDEVLEKAVETLKAKITD